MKFTKKMKEFMSAYARFVNNEIEPSSPILRGLDLGDLEYCSPSDGKRNLGSDFGVVGADFRKATEEAKKKQKYGETSTAK